ncbi:MAG TPA: CopD family protein [Gemmatimonadaceae bacterium]
MSEPFFHWGESAFEYIGFLSSFFIIGAIAFRAFILRPMIAAGGLRADALRSAGPTAARIGFIGAVLGGIGLVHSLMGFAARRHLTFGAAAAAGGWNIAVPAVLLVVLLIVFALAATRLDAAWPVAIIAGFALALRSVPTAITGRWQSMINPLHVLFGSLWLGTLFVVVVAGLSLAIRGPLPRDSRGATVAEMVNRFSTLALISAACLVLTGTITAVLHLKYVAALWTTPYGRTFIVKLCVVLGVVALGAWNWRRVRPSLGGEESARIIRRTASSELAMAALVLAVTSVLVTLPTPKKPKAAPPAAATAAPAGP